MPKQEEVEVKKIDFESDDDDVSSVASEELESESEHEGGDAASVVSSDSASDSASQAGSEASLATIDLLGGDPLFLVLSKFFMTSSSESGRNIADILEDISHSLKKLVHVTKKKSH